MLSSKGTATCVLIIIICICPRVQPAPIAPNDVRFTAPHRSSNPVRPVFTKLNATRYLREYGWLPKPSEVGYRRDSLMTREEYEDALRGFQRFANLPETGTLDEKTKAKMLEPRCGVRDVEEDEVPELGGEGTNSGARRFKRYTIEGSYWGVKKIKYRIKKYTKSNNINREKVDKFIRKSFKVWEESSPLQFVESNSNENVHINVMFVKGAHGDGEPFDGRGQILAHAFFPRYGGDVHFDEDEPWSAPKSTGIDLYSVAAHEIGHSLGLKHSDNHHALMAPFYQKYTGDTIRLHKDDIKGLQHLYGNYQRRGCDCLNKEAVYCSGHMCGCKSDEEWNFGWCVQDLTKDEISKLKNVRHVEHQDVPFQVIDTDEQDDSLSRKSSTDYVAPSGRGQYKLLSVG